MIGILGDPHKRHLLLTLLAGAGLVAYLTGSVPSLLGFDLALVLALAGGFPIYLNALSALLKGKISADLAVSLAAAAAIYIGQYIVAAEVIFIMLIGEALEHYAIGRARTGIAGLLELRPQEARVRRHGHEHVIPAGEIEPDDIVIVRPGDRIAVDGRVLGGSSTVDQSSLTGESLPADKNPGDEVYAGTINLHGALELSVDRVGEYTALEQIIHLVEKAEEARAPTERLADRYAAYFVPLVLLVAALTYAVTGDVIRAVTVLVVACPCALVLATPTAIAAGIGYLVRRGILIKGGMVLEKLGRLRSIVFDKTGTLTLARLRIREIVSAPGHDRAEVLRLGASVERNSEHPVGRLIVRRAEDDRIEPPGAADFLAHPGLGAQGVVEGALARVGSPRYLAREKVEVPPDLEARVRELAEGGCTVVLVAREEKAIGAIAVEDTVRPEAREVMESLRGQGIGRIVMLTGDNEPAARSVAESLGIGEVQSGLLPADKVEAIRSIQGEAPPVAMVGDGINDAPSLVTADVGVAMADIGTDVAVASADAVLVGDDLRKLTEAIFCGRRVLKVIWQNILAFALAFNALAVAAAFLGWISPVAGAILHQVSSLTVVLNSLRLLLDVRLLRERLERAGRALGRRWRAALAGMSAAAAILYLLSGFHVVDVGEIGVVQHFGKIARPGEPPGLHYRLPYPLGRHQVVKPGQIHRVEVGFRTTSALQAEPPAYEWSFQHRGGRYERRAEEATVLTGDENLADINMVVHYRVADPLAALFRLGRISSAGENKWDILVRDVAEAGLRAEMSRCPIDSLLGSRRGEIEKAIRNRMAHLLKGTGLAVAGIFLGDVHPPLDVVPAFREVTSAREEKEARINDAEAYQYERQALARGEARKELQSAEARSGDRTERAGGSAARFLSLSDAYRSGPVVTRLRLYLQAVEKALAGRRLVIIDRPAGGARRQLYLGKKGFFNPAPPVPPETTPPGDETQGNPEQ